MRLCKRYRVSGNVQGVFFRVSTWGQANEIGVTGWVRNTNNNDVELVACGTYEKLLRLEAWLQKGPPLATVKNIESEEIEGELFTDFSLRF